MTFIVSAFRFGAINYADLPYAIVYNSSNISITAAATLAMNSETVDAVNVHDNVTNNSRLTVPAGWNGRYGRIVQSTSADIGFGITMWKNGAIFRGAARQDVGNFLGNDNYMSASAPISLATGDYFELRGLGSAAGNYLAADNSWFSIELLDTNFSGCLAYNSTIQACGAGAVINLAWDTEVYDVGGWHDTVTNNSRMTVPSGVSLVRLSSSAKTDATETGQIAIQHIKNGAVVLGCGYADMESADVDGIAIYSAPIACTAGDYFQTTFYTDTASDADNDEEVWMAIEKLPSDLKYSLVYRTTDFSIPSTSVPTAVDWDAESVDTDAWHSTGTNPSRFTVPAGVDYVRLCFNVQGQNVAGEWGARVTKNGAFTTKGLVACETNTGSIDQVNGMTGIISVTAGDYFELECYSNVASQAVESANSLSWFSIEEVRDTI